jgi:hypothetical protein
MTNNITPSSLPILARLLFPLTERACDRICNRLIALLDAESDFDDPTQLNPFDLDRIMTLARLYDPTCSTHAAHIRDTIRDNCDYPI